ncbi:MAG: glucosamine-6-phosphate deaminase [Planctomycetota bacterium]|nr:MAG: glucosamine-6-phosphate deaminase [Planctomycetota bacterium]
MTLIISADAASAATRLADILEQAILAQPNLTMGLATGRTSSAAYEQLVARHHENTELAFRHVTTFNTDEFVPLPATHPMSARYLMNYRLFRHVDIKLENTYIPHGDAADLTAECRAYEAMLKARGGLDLVVLGLGHNGHVGFNEPGSSVKSRTRVVEFTTSTLAALSDGYRFTSIDKTPRQAISMGMGTILSAKHILLIATGISKAHAVHRMFDCRPGPSVPASLLLAHPNITVIIDKNAAAQIAELPPDTIHIE